MATLADGRPLIVIGLSSKNLDMLRARRPCLINMDELGGKGEVAIMWGETEQAIWDEMKQAGMVSDQTEVRNYPEGMAR